MSDSKTESGVLTSWTLAESTLNRTRRILARCVAGDEVAWRVLHGRYYPIATAFLRRLGVAEASIEDATQDVFVEVFRYLPGFRGESEFKTWLYRLCITQARRVRRRGNLVKILGAVMPWELDSSARQGELCAKTAAGLVSLALNSMSNAEREVFVLYELEGLRGKRIAEIIGRPEASVWRRLHHARARFRKAIDGRSATDRGALTSDRITPVPESEAR